MLDVAGRRGDVGQPGHHPAVDLETAARTHVGRRYSKQFSMVNAAVRTYR
jgi:hypothetical protein